MSDGSRCTDEKPEVKRLIYTARYKRGEAQEIDQGNYGMKPELSSVCLGTTDVELGLTREHVAALKTSRLQAERLSSVSTQYTTNLTVELIRLDL